MLCVRLARPPLPTHAVHRPNRLRPSSSLPPRTLLRRLSTAPSIERKHPNVLVVGAGVSGLTLAISLLRAGIRPDVVEQTREDREGPSSVISEGIFLPCNAIKIFRDIGVGDAVAKAGKVLDEMQVKSEKGGVFGKLNLKQSAKELGAPAVGIDHHTLLKALYFAFASMGGKVAFRTSPSKIRQAGQSVVCSFSGGKATATYDLVVGADGADSKVRDSLFEKVPFRIQKRFDKWGYYTAKCTRPVTVDSARFSEIWGSGSRFYILPTSDTTISVMATTNSVYPPSYLKGGPRTLDELAGVVEQRFPASGVQDILKTLRAESRDCTLQFPYELKMKSWTNGHAVLIGDAAHVVMPNLPQLSALAVEDGYLLAKYLTEKSVDQALQDFLFKRYPRVYNAQKEAWDISDSGQASSWFRRIIRATRMRVTHSTIMLNRREKRLAGGKDVLL